MKFEIDLDPYHCVENNFPCWAAKMFFDKNLQRIKPRCYQFKKFLIEDKTRDKYFRLSECIAEEKRQEGK